MIYKKLRICEAGETANSVMDADGASYKLSISPESLDSLVKLGNTKPIHCRKTHNGSDLLDQYVGSFSNFSKSGSVVYADFTLSPALEKAYPSEAAFISTLIEKEPEMLGISIISNDIKNYDKDSSTASISEFTELFTCDIVGLPAATSSLFNNQNNNNKMGISKFFSKFAALVAATQLATQIVETDKGEKITIEAAGEEMAIGDKVFDGEGKPHADGEIIVKVGEGDDRLVLVVKDGAITDVKKYEREEDRRREVVTEVVPEEFSKRMEAMEKAQATMTTVLNTISTSISKLSTNPDTSGNRGRGVGGDTKLNRDDVQKAWLEMRKTMKK